MMEGVVVTVVIVANYCGGDVGDGDNSGVEDAGGGDGGCGYRGDHGVGGCSDRKMVVVVIGVTVMVAMVTVLVIVGAI